MIDSFGLTACQAVWAYLCPKVNCGGGQIYLNIFHGSFLNLIENCLHLFVAKWIWGRFSGQVCRGNFKFTVMFF